MPRHAVVDVPARHAPAVLASFALAAVAHIGPAVTWLPGLRYRFFPRLAGAGRPDHVALTFDDGPDPTSTPRFLDALDGLGVRATFFLLGESVARHPALAREIAERGHELAVHGWTHDRPWLPAPARETADLARAVDAVGRAGGRPPRWYRPPYGILTSSRWAAARRVGVRPVLWTAWGRDWTAEATPASVRTAVGARLRGGGTLLLHDSDRHSATGCWRASLGALAHIVEDCRAAGLSIGPLAEHGTEALDVAQPGSRGTLSIRRRV
ncbi:polysaccharide deacetylase family protein [Streptomyces sp. NPDC052051]|uniref:polysaccharide deacetylase family protein n=1 Tax=Streptomyces sp. NPDC052051 TaxID=3154649 RepID=UPI0034221141